MKGIFVTLTACRPRTALRTPARRRRILLGPLGALLLMAGTAVADPPTLSAPMAARIDGLVRSALSAGQIPGASVAIERRGHVIYQKGFGFADLENKVAVTPETVFPIGSITKTMTGLAIQQLIAAGKIDLDAPVGRYLPTLPAPAREAKIRFLLEHTSGIVGYTDVPGFPNNAQAPMTRDDVLGWFAARPLLFPSGTRWSYTNSGFYLLGLVIEAVSGMPYADYVQQHEFNPFGMSNSTLAGWTPLIAGRAHGYRHGARGFENAPRYDALLPFAAGAVMSTTGDLLKYRRGVFGVGSTPAAIRSEILRQDRLPDGFVLPYSLGCLVLGTFEGHRRIGHPGDIYGFSAQYSYYPDDELTIVILTNTQDAPFPPIAIEQKIARVLFAVPPPAIENVSLPAPIAAQLLGEYEVGHLRFGFDRIAFILKDGALQMELGGEGAPAIPLRYQGGTAFVSTVDDEQRIDFAPSAVGMDVTVTFYGSPLVLHRIAAPAH
jgi:CubicO group peptidase (beta-lactamase class C family)